MKDRRGKHVWKVTVPTNVNKLVFEFRVNGCLQMVVMSGLNRIVLTLLLFLCMETIKQSFTLCCTERSSTMLTQCLTSWRLNLMRLRTDHNYTYLIAQVKCFLSFILLFFVLTLGRAFRQKWRRNGNNSSRGRSGLRRACGESEWHEPSTAQVQCGQRGRDVTVEFSSDVQQSDHADLRRSLVGDNRCQWWTADRINHW